MSAAESFAGRVETRLARRLSSPDGAMAITGVEIIAIIGAIISACDQFNPGWRDQLISFIGRLLPPWDRKEREARRIEAQGRKIRERARLAFDPDQAPPFKRGQARRDRAILLDAIRGRVQMLAHHVDVPPENAVADAIVEETLVSSDTQIEQALRNLGAFNRD